MSTTRTVKRMTRKRGVRALDRECIEVSFLDVREKGVSMKRSGEENFLSVLLMVFEGEK
jgi:hypothetical protein